jgi:hypothetical protein
MMAVSLAAWLSVAAAGPAAVVADSVANPSFEKVGPPSMPAGWHGDRQVYAIDLDVHHGGKSSLRLVNADPGRYPSHPSGTCESPCGMQ